MIGKLQKMHVDNWNNINLRANRTPETERSEKRPDGPRVFLARTVACDPYKYEYQAMQHKKVNNQAAVV